MVGNLGSQSLHSKSNWVIPRLISHPHTSTLLDWEQLTKACQPVPCLATLIKLCSSNIGH